MARRLRVGIIGLGRRWRRYRLVLARLGDDFQVRAVCDHVALRAEAEARALGCAAAAGPVDLLGREDVEAVLVLDRQWFGLWPLECACAAGKPVLCAVPLADDDAHADELAVRVRDRGLPVLMAHPLSCAPALDRLRELLADGLGPARVARADLTLPAPRRPGADLLGGGTAAVLLARCGALLGDAPAGVSVIGGQAAGLVTLVADYPGGRVAQVSVWTGPAAVGACRLEAAGAKGTAVARLPRRVRWRDAAGQHAELLPGLPAEEVLLRQFAEALAAGRPPRPGFEEAYEALAWQRAAWRSRSEGRRVALGPAAG
jgi:predicted dehydrogenase